MLFERSYYYKHNRLHHTNLDKIKYIYGTSLKIACVYTVTLQIAPIPCLHNFMDRGAANFHIPMV